MTNDERVKAYLTATRAKSLPKLPWTHAALGEEIYCNLARSLGYFDPGSESADYRPSLDPTPYLSMIAKGDK